MNTSRFMLHCCLPDVLLIMLRTFTMVALILQHFSLSCSTLWIPNDSTNISQEDLKQVAEVLMQLVQHDVSSPYRTYA